MSVRKKIAYGGNFAVQGRDKMSNHCRGSHIYYLY